MNKKRNEYIFKLSKIYIIVHKLFKTILKVAIQLVSNSNGQLFVKVKKLEHNTMKMKTKLLGEPKKTERTKKFALQNCNICKQDSENCPVNLSNGSSHYVIKSSTKDDLNPQ